MKTDALEDFTRLCKVASKYLTELSPKIRGVVFASYSGKALRIEYQGYEDYIAEAISKDYVTNDLEPDWDTTKLMSNIRKSLDEINAFLIEKSVSEDFRRAYESIYEAPLLISNMTFWEDVIGVHIQI